MGTLTVQPSNPQELPGEVPSNGYLEEEPPPPDLSSSGIIATDITEKFKQACQGTCCPKLT